ncbi:MAG TPA: hypothetical protein VK918_10215 [Pyrinomonadaceae bacterium]|nr:hypothetical protein [Pyrinomonadaceae bacterium]
MKNRTSLMLINALLLITVVAVTAASAQQKMHDDASCVANSMTIAQINHAQRATAAFHSVQAAERAGYTNINLPVPNMGEHWVNFDLVDDVFEPDKPEALVYADLGSGRLQLVAVEYLVPLSANPPEGFEGTCDQWTPFGDVFWTLHAWVWYPNISGTFSKFNPLVP